jgi:Ca2+-binding EF-hand superfamily protein
VELAERVVLKRRQGLDRVVFRELLHNAFDLVTEDVLMDRIFCTFDRTCCGSVRLEDWLCGLSVFLRGSLEERTGFCFRVYDLNSDGFITRDEMFSLLK